jgi:hypothetical protein
MRRIFSFSLMAVIAISFMVVAGSSAYAEKAKA